MADDTQKVNYPEQIKGTISGGGITGIGAQDEGVFLGTGTIFNFVGNNIDASISGSVVRVFVTGTQFTPGVDQIGIYAQDEGIPLGTGTVFNFVGPMMQASISGTVVRVMVTGTPVSFDDNEGDPADVTISGTAYDGSSLFPSRRDHRHLLEGNALMDYLGIYLVNSTAGMNVTYYPNQHGFYFDAITQQDLRYMPIGGWIPLTGITGTYVSADSPTFVMSIPNDYSLSIEAGMRFRCSQSSTLKYFIVTAVSGTVTSTNITLYGGTDYTLANAAVVAPCYSPLKKPVGFPTSPSKWSQTLVVGGNQTQTSPVAGTYYNLGSQSLVMPIGVWDISFQGNGYLDRASAATMIMQFGLSTSNNSVSDTTLVLEWAVGSIALLQQPLFIKPLPITRTTKATYYVIGMSNTSGAANLIIKSLVVQFVCAYL